MCKFWLAIVLCIGGLQLSGEESRKIVCLLSPPRSLSVGFTRMMESRGDFTIFHEPCVSVYNAMKGYEFSLEWFREDAFKTFDEVKNAIYQETSLFL